MTKLLGDKVNALEKRVLILEKDGRVEHLGKENALLRLTVDAQSARLDQLDTITKRDNIIIRGLPETSYSERATASHSDDGGMINDSHTAVESTVIAFCRDMLHVTVSANDIASAHRMKAGTKDITRPIMVRFATRRKRDVVYRSKKALKICFISTKMHSRQVFDIVRSSRTHHSKSLFKKNATPPPVFDSLFLQTKS